VCEEKGWGWLRLDGSTMVGDRQQLVDRFNSSFGEERVFLLSSKAGGMGLNLVGANR
jgi:SNF2 family DNA or RNA helicase